MQTICCTQSSAWTPITQDSEVCRQCSNACYHTLRVAVNLLAVISVNGQCSFSLALMNSYVIQWLLKPDTNCLQSS